MFEYYKAKNAMSLEEAIDKYSKEYYINLTFKPNGCVELFIGSEKNKANIEIKEGNNDVK